MDSGMVKVTYKKSALGYSARQKATIRSLGLRRLGDTVIQPDNGAVRGMVAAVSHLVVCEPLGEVKVIGEATEKTSKKSKEDN